MSTMATTHALDRVALCGGSSITVCPDGFSVSAWATLVPTLVIYDRPTTFTPGTAHAVCAIHAPETKAPMTPAGKQRVMGAGETYVARWYERRGKGLPGPIPP